MKHELLFDIIMGVLLIITIGTCLAMTYKSPLEKFIDEFENEQHHKKPNDN